MLTNCRCRIPDNAPQHFEELTLCTPDRFSKSVHFKNKDPLDPMGRDGYHLMSHLPLHLQREVIENLPTQGHGGQVRRFATAVTQLAEELITQYRSRPCSIDDIPIPPKSSPERPMRGAKWTLKVFIRRFLRHRAPELAQLPIHYMSQSPSTRAAYRPSEDIIFVGNTIIQEIRDKRFISVLSTLHHEKTHRDSEKSHRTISESLVNEAIDLAAENFYNPNCAPTVFKKLALRQLWWEKDDDGNSEYVDHEDELYARITQLAFRFTHRSEQPKTAAEDIDKYESFLHSHIAGIANRFSPIVADVILGYVEETIKTDIPRGYPFLTSNMYSDAHYIQIRSALESYRDAQQLCQTGVRPACTNPSAHDGRMMAEQR